MPTTFGPLSFLVSSFPSPFHRKGYFHPVLTTHSFRCPSSTRPPRAHVEKITNDHVAWRVTPTTDLGKPLDLLLHLPSEGGRRGEEEGPCHAPGSAEETKSRLGRGEVGREDRLLPKSVTAFYSRMIAGIWNREEQHIHSHSRINLRHVRHVHTR